VAASADVSSIWAAISPAAVHMAAHLAGRMGSARDPLRRGLV
jgi:hypothetical protein